MGWRLLKGVRRVRFRNSSAETHESVNTSVRARLWYRAVTCVSFRVENELAKIKTRVLELLHKVVFLKESVVCRGVPELVRKEGTQ